MVVIGDPRLPARFWAKVQARENGCLIWTAQRGRDGYGIIKMAGRPRKAHIVAYEALVGPVPTGMQLGHVCHDLNRECPGGPCEHRACILHVEPQTARQNLSLGRTLAAANAAVTACPKGHPYDAHNTRVYRGHRYCRACDRLRPARGHHRRKGAR